MTVKKSLFGGAALQNAQLGVGKAEIMANFVDYDLPDTRLDFLLRAAQAEDGAHVQDYPVREDIAVIETPLAERDTLVQAEQGLAPPDFHLPEEMARRLLLHHDLYVL